MQARTLPRTVQGRQPAANAASAASRGTKPATRTLGSVKVPTVQSVKKPTGATTQSPQRYAYSVSEDDSDNYTSSSDDSWGSPGMNSEQFQPLAFTLVNGGPKRAIGGIAQSHHLMCIAESKGTETDSDSELSMDESPLSVHFQANNTKRCCGRIAKSMGGETVVTSALSNDDSSTSSRPLPVTIELRKRSRMVGPTPFTEVLEARSGEDPKSPTPDSDEDEALQAEIIMNLVRRFRDPSTQPGDIPLEAFQVVNWDDDTFQPELEPLRKLYEYLEAMASLKKNVTAPAIASQKRSALQSKIKEAVMELPTERAMAAKVQKLKNRAVRSSAPKHSLYKSEFGEASAPGKARSARNGKPESEKSTKSAQPTKRKVNNKAMSGSGILDNVPVVAVKSEKPTKAHAGKKEKLKDSMMMSMTSFASSAKEGQMSASVSEIFKPGAKPMAAHKPKTVAKESTMSEKPSKTRCAVAKRKKNNPNRSVSFTDTGFPQEEDAIVERETDTNIAPESEQPERNEKTVRAAPPALGGIMVGKEKRAGRRRNERRSHPGQSVSFASLPDELVGEMVESATAPEAAGSQARGVPRRRRRGKPRNNQSCSFSDVQLAYAGELVERTQEVLGQDAPATTAADAAAASEDHADKSTPNGVPGAKGKNKVLRHRVVSRAAKKGLEMSVPDYEQAGEIDENSVNGAGTTTTPSAFNAASQRTKKTHRPNIARSRELSVSQLDDGAVGEIYENPDDLAYINNCSRPGTGFGGKKGSTPTSRPISRTIDRRPRRASAILVETAPQEEVPDDIGKIPATAAAVHKPPAKRTSKQGPADAPKKRKKRKMISLELSISAIPEDEAGEIQEYPDGLLSTQSSADRKLRALRPTPKQSGVTLPRLQSGH